MNPNYLIEMNPNTMTSEHEVIYRNAYGDGYHRTGVVDTQMGWVTAVGGQRVFQGYRLDTRVLEVIDPPFNPKVGTVLADEAGEIVAVRITMDSNGWLDPALNERVNNSDVARNVRNNILSVVA